MTLYRTTWALPAVALALTWTVSASVAGPRLILVTGSLLERPVVLDDWEENMALMVAMARPVTIDPNVLRDRPHYRLAMFWGPEWARYVEAGRPIEELTPEQATQHARFYPATARSAAVIVIEDQPGPFGNGARITGLTRSVDPKGLDVLARRGIRIRVESSAPGAPAHRRE